MDPMFTKTSRVIASATAVALALGTVAIVPARADGYQYPPAEPYQNQPPMTEAAPPVPPGYDVPQGYEVDPGYDVPPAYAVPPGYGAPVRYDNGAGAAAALMLFGTLGAIIASKRHRHYDGYNAYGYGPGRGGPVHFSRGFPQGRSWAPNGPHWGGHHHR
jgi:hypothetical protein